MHHFLIVVSRSPGGLDEGLEALLGRRSCPTIPVEPTTHVHWRASSSPWPVHFASWVADELVEPVVSAEIDGVRAVAGQPIVTEPIDRATFLRPNALEPLERRSTDLTDRLDGAYALVAMRSDGSGTVVSDPVGLEPLYIGRAGQLTAISNRPQLVAEAMSLASGRPVRPDENAVAWVLLNGHMLGNATGYEGVERVPFCDAVIFAPGVEPRSVPWHRPAWLSADGFAMSVSDAIDCIESRMIAAIRVLVDAHDAVVTSELTAGRDSRMVLDLLARGRLLHEVGFCTYPVQASPDRAVATQIAKQLGLHHEFRLAPTRPSGPHLESFVAHTRAVAGQLSCWDSSLPAESRDRVLSGHLGETLRTKHPKRSGHTTVDAARSAFARHRFGRLRYVRANVATDLHERAGGLFLAPSEAGARPEDLFDWFFVEHRYRRWLGDKPDRFERCFMPLYSPFASRVVVAKGSGARANAFVHEEVKRRANLPIDGIAFEKGSSWRSRPAQEPTDARSPLAPAAEIDPRAGDRVRCDAFRAALEFDRANRAFELVDRETLLADVDRYAELDRRDRIELHQALTVVLWLGLARPDASTWSAAGR